ncbi:hypothetical protein J2W14_003308 [Pseudarthrobacter oxydans]|uniref:DUF5343 domain-containing protein n=1 Tax=Pseudarthrobacter oxydans TaxID=1671 RepID=UPI002783F686|nr:DUF5343 domain-containing protein [Pseudarthrobacter oxydans]MDP9983885.1 hypothetical protein [Pseudarthrobacter oxydans]
MADEVIEQKKFPYMSLTAWAKLRRTYQKVAWPSKVTNNSLASALDWSEKAVQNIMPQLRNIGLIDVAGVPTDLAHDFRFEDSYPAVCEKIIADTYPLELREVFSDPNSDPVKVAQWFMRHSKSGEASAKAQAKFYLNLLAAEPLKDEEKPKPSAPRKPRAKVAPGSDAKPAKASTTAIDSPVLSQTEHASTEAHPTHAPAKPRHQDGPSLHIDMQVHIDPAATPEQIDSIFASMAKHLYGR